MRKLGSKSLRGHSRSLDSRKLGSKSPRDREDSARSHFKVTWLKKTQLEVTSKSFGSGKRGSKSVRSHLARDTSPRTHFGVTWHKRLEVTSRSLGLGKLRPKSLRSHLGRENSTRSHFGAASQCHFKVPWLEKTRVEVTSKFRSYAKKLFEKTVPGPLNSEALSSAPPRTEDGYPRVHTSIHIYIYICISNSILIP